MDELFRFVLRRPANATAPAEVNTLSASFLEGEPTWDSAKSLAAQALKDGKLLSAGTQVVYEDVARAVVGLLGPGPRAASDVVALVQKVAGKDPTAIATDAEFSAAVAAVSDTLVALKLLSSSEGRDAADLTTIARGLDAITRTANGANPVALRPLALPAALSTAVPGPAQTTPPAGPSSQPSEPADDGGNISNAKAQLARIEAAIAEIGRLRASDFATLPMRPAAQPPSRERITGQAVKASSSSVRRAAPLQSASARVERPWTLSTTAAASLSADVQATLQDFGLNPSTDALPMVMSAMHGQQQQQIEVVNPSVVPQAPSAASAYVGPPSSSMPSGHGSVQPVGIGDLLLVRQHTKAYEGGEVAHIENILRSEHMSRDTRRLERTESTLTQETETTKEEERDNQTTERFSLTRETTNTIQNDSEFKAGLSVDAKYGPFIEVKANADYSTKSSQQESTKQASEYSKDVVSRSVSKVVERVRQQQTVTTLVEFEEKYSHGFDNTAGTQHVSGVYQWVDQVLEAQIYNYGKRLLFDVTVPEPATTLIVEQASNQPTPQGLTEPTPFTIDASQITEINYTKWAQKYDATGLEPPPPLTKTFSKPFANVQSQDPHEAAGTESITIDDGYAAQYALLQTDWIVYDGANWRVLIGSVWADALGSQVYFDMAGETGTLPLAFDMIQVETYAMTVEVFCQRTARALDAWRLKTHATILQAFVTKQAAYRQALAEAQAQAAGAAFGRNPGLNAQLINNELRKQCLTLVTGQEFDSFGALELSSEGYAEPDLSLTAQQMPYVRFFEQAFEWDRMTYVFYPYFWGWKQAWNKRMLLDDTDPAYSVFLRAGAARVVFPVQPGFESAILHYLETGEIWNGGPPPDVNSSLYVPIVKEIQDAEGAPGAETPQGDPWTVRLPTTLVHLRPNDDLPTWTRVGDEWVPSN